MPTEEDLAKNKQSKDKASSRKRIRENGSQTDLMAAIVVKRQQNF